MNILLDTHALFWYITGDKKLPKTVKDDIEKASRIFLPTIVSLDLATIQVVIDLPSGLEMHDRIILASAKILNVLLLTKDKNIQRYYKIHLGKKWKKCHYPSLGQ